MFVNIINPLLLPHIQRERERERERERCAAVVTVGHVARGVLVVGVGVHTTDNWQSV